jgi:hypothetical protein
MPGIVLAWLVGEGMVVYRAYKNEKRPVLPGQLLASSAVFAVCGLIAEAPGAAFLGAAMAWGFDVALFLESGPAWLSGATKDVSKATAPTKTKDVQAV